MATTTSLHSISGDEKLGAEVAVDWHPTSNYEDTLTYPSGFKLAIFTLALALAVFFVALVSRSVRCLRCLQRFVLRGCP